MLLTCYLLVTYRENFVLFHTVSQTSRKLKKTPKTLCFRGLLLFCRYSLELSLAELRSASCGFEAVLREFLSCFPLIFRAFPAFCLSVIRCADHKKRPFFIQRQADETHHLLPQTTPLVYCTSLLHKCP